MHIGPALSGLNAAQVSFNGLGSAQSTAPQDESLPKIGFAPKTPPPERVGFGEGTITVPGAAAKTIGQNMKQAGQIVHTLQEVRAHLREEAAAQEQQPVAQIQIDIQKASAQASYRSRQLVSSLNTAAGTALARVQGEAPPSTGVTLDIRIGDQTVSFQRTPPRPTLNIAG